MKRRSIVSVAGIITLLFSGVYGSEDSDTPKLGFKSGGYVYWENFRIGSADYNGDTQRGDWFSSILAGLVLENMVGDRLKTRVALEAKTYRPFPEESGKEKSRFTNFTTYVQEAKAVYAFGNPDNPVVDMEVGYFLYDYNKDQRNLGEYLFRSQLYPCNLFTDFELPMDKLLGIRFGHSPSQLFRHDLLLTSEYRLYPKSDFSLAYLGNFNVRDIFKASLGAQYSHLIPVKKGTTAPRIEENTYVEIPAQTWRDSAGVEHTISAPIEGLKKAVVEDPDNSDMVYTDPSTFRKELYSQVRHKNTYYSYQGVKLMGMASFDMKPLFGSPEFFGESDLKIYTEFAVLGLKDYPYFYENILDRVPVMVGFCLPPPISLVLDIFTDIRILDILAIEVERYSYPLPNNYQKSLREGIPHPGSSLFLWDGREYKQDDWKWSVYLRKEIVRGLTISGQVARDHLRLLDQENLNYQTVMKTRHNWWWIIRVTASY